MHFSDDLIAKLRKAASEAEFAKLLKAAGQDQTQAETLWKELEAKREQEGKELSLDEMEVVSGGADRDWLKDGCAATMEPGSNCWGTDYCALWPVTYTHWPSKDLCSNCRINLLADEETDYYTSFKCPRCGKTVKKYIVYGD